MRKAGDLSLTCNHHSSKYPDCRTAEKSNYTSIGSKTSETLTTLTCLLSTLGSSKIPVSKRWLLEMTSLTMLLRFPCITPQSSVSATPGCDAIANLLNSAPKNKTNHVGYCEMSSHNGRGLRLMVDSAGLARSVSHGSWRKLECV